MARKKRKVSGPSAEPPVAAERSLAKPSRSRSAPNSSQSASLERLPASSAAMPRLTPRSNSFRFRAVGIEHARVHLGGELLPHPRRQQQMGRADLAQIVHDRALVLREIDPDPAEQRHRRHVDLLDDPGQRQDRHVLVGRLARIRPQIGRAVLQERPMLEHRELGVGGRARGRAQHRDVVAAPRRDRRFEALDRDALAALDQLRAVQQSRVLVFAHAALIVVDDPAQARQLVRDLQDLVRLLLVLDERELGLGVAEQIGDLFRQRVLVDAERDGADRLRRQLRPQPVRPVAADDPDHVAALDVERQQSARQLLDPGARVRPGVDLPDAVVLLPQRDLGAPVRRVVQQQLGGGVVPGQVR